MLWKLDGLSEYDVRRPLTPTGTNLLGLVKHLASVESGYFGATFGRPYPETLPWHTEEADHNDDMFATAEESREDIVAFYRRVWAHSDATIEAADLDTVGRVDWWPPERAEVTLHTILVRLVAETNRHAGHADIVRELIDQQVGYQALKSNLPEDDYDWAAHHARVERAAQDRRTRGAMSYDVVTDQKSRPVSAIVAIVVAILTGGYIRVHRGAHRWRRTLRAAPSCRKLADMSTAGSRAISERLLAAFLVGASTDGLLRAPAALPDRRHRDRPADPVFVASRPSTRRVPLMATPSRRSSPEVPLGDRHPPWLRGNRLGARHGLPAYSVLGVLPATVRFLSRPRTGPGLQAAGDRSVRMIGGPEAWTATVCSACAPREPSLLLMVQPSLSMKMSSVLCRNHGSMAMTRPAFSG